MSNRAKTDDAHMRDPFPPEFKGYYGTGIAGLSVNGSPVLAELLPPELKTEFTIASDETKSAILKIVSRQQCVSCLRAYRTLKK